LFIFNNAVYNRLASTCFWQAKKKSRRLKRAKNAKEVGPSPADGPLRPIVCCTTQQHNRQVRAGRGVNLTGFDWGVGCRLIGFVFVFVCFFVCMHVWLVGQLID
jgi:hypothetical protein